LHRLRRTSGWRSRSSASKGLPCCKSVVLRGRTSRISHLVERVMVSSVTGASFATCGCNVPTVRPPVPRSARDCGCAGRIYLTGNGTSVPRVCADHVLLSISLRLPRTVAIMIVLLDGARGRSWEGRRPLTWRALAGALLIPAPAAQLGCCQNHD
jgi:hypothetical protein